MQYIFYCGSSILDIPSVDEFADDMDDESNEIDDEFEKVNNPLSYHLKQHFRMRRRQRNQRSHSINESPNHHQLSLDNEKVNTLIFQTISY